MQGAHGHDGPDSRRTRRTGRGTRIAASLAGVTALVLFAGACSDSDSDSDSAAGGGSTSSATTQGSKSTLAYAQCMRKNGVKNFPDPNAQGLIDINGNEVDMKSEQAQSADAKCKSLLPAAGTGAAPEAVREASLAYAKCMRKNGVPKFPDPNADGGLDINGETLGVDPNGDVFKKAD
jgi:hypothetical protein